MGLSNVYILAELPFPKLCHALNTYGRSIKSGWEFLSNAKKANFQDYVVDTICSLITKYKFNNLNADANNPMEDKKQIINPFFDKVEEIRARLYNAKQAIFSGKYALTLVIGGANLIHHKPSVSPRLDQTFLGDIIEGQPYLGCKGR